MKEAYRESPVWKRPPPPLTFTRSSFLFSAHLFHPLRTFQYTDNPDTSRRPVYRRLLARERKKWEQKGGREIQREREKKMKTGACTRVIAWKAPKTIRAISPVVHVQHNVHLLEKLAKGSGDDEKRNFLTGQLPPNKQGPKNAPSSFSVNSFHNEQQTRGGTINSSRRDASTSHDPSSRLLLHPCIGYAARWIADERIQLASYQGAIYWKRRGKRSVGVCRSDGAVSFFGCEGV